MRDRRWHTKQCQSAGDGGGRAALTAPPPTRLMENAPSRLAHSPLLYNVRRTPSHLCNKKAAGVINIYIRCATQVAKFALAIWLGANGTL